MRILGIDTASGIASVALVEDARVLGENASATAGHRSDLLLLIDALCAAADLSPRDLDAVAIGAGPGSFTGLRIGMATAKGIAFAANRPLWAVSSLAALAFAADAPGRLVVGVLDARRGEVYAGAYRKEDARLVLLGEERVMPPGELAAFRDAYFIGDAQSAYPELGALDGSWGVTPSAAAVAKLALAGARVDVLVRGAPSYIRPSEAEIRYPDGVPGALRKR